MEVSLDLAWAAGLFEGEGCARSPTASTFSTRSWASGGGPEWTNCAHFSRRRMSVGVSADVRSAASASVFTIRRRGGSSRERLPAVVSVVVAGGMEMTRTRCFVRWVRGGVS
jgi:hypothetical protein